MKKQFTATVYILEEDKVLLHFHKKLQKWLPPGGHLEADELPSDGAKREALEETGLHIEIIKDEHIWVSRWNAESFERPWLCLLENIPAHGNEGPHQHIDFIYLGRPVGGAITDAHREQHEIRWFTLDEVMELKEDLEIFAETQATLQNIFSKISFIYTRGA